MLGILDMLLVLVIAVFATALTFRWKSHTLTRLFALWNQGEQAHRPVSAPLQEATAPHAQATQLPLTLLRQPFPVSPTALFTAIILGGGAVALVMFSGGSPAPAVQATEKQTVYLDRFGRPLARAGGYRRRTSDEFSPYLADLAVAVEDRRFWLHPCVDPVGVLRAATANLLRGRKEGASSICMQTARALDGERTLPPDGTWRGKFAETAAGVRLLAHVRSKRRLLTLYLNQVYVGHSSNGPLRGMEAAALHYFGRPAIELTLAQAATLVGMIQAPARFDPRDHPHAARERRDYVLRMLARQRPEYAARVATALRERMHTRAGAPPRGWGLATRLDALFPAGMWGGVSTTLDSAVQVRVERLTLAELGRMRARAGWRRDRPGNRITAATLVMSTDGEVRGYACGHPAAGGELAGWDPCRNGRIALASTIKIFLTAFALDYGVTRPEERLRDLSERHGNPHLRGAFLQEQCPSAHLEFTVRQSLALSSNCLAVLLHATLPTGARVGMARIGIPVDPAAPATALGTQTLPVSVLLAYVAALENGGSVPTPRLSDGVMLARPLVDSLPLRPAALAATRALLRDVVAGGTARSAAPYLRGLPAYAKTGTHQDLDVRIVGGTGQGTVALMWVGHARPQPLSDLDAGKILGASWGRVLAGVLSPD